MPLAALFGLGDSSMTALPGPLLDPARVVVIGARSYEAAELVLLQALGVRIYEMAEIAERGLSNVFAEARQIVSGSPWGISFDLDAIDPRAAPGVSTPAADGLVPAELIHELRGVLRERLCVALEIAEYNPGRDVSQASGELILDLIEAASSPDGAVLRRWEEGFGAHNYSPLPVVLKEGHGCWLTDVDGKRYLDLMSAYSATSFGHAHPRLLAALGRQAARLAVTSRAYFNDRLPRFLRRLTLLTGYERALPLNTGLEAVETALKAARKWAYQIKGVPHNQAEIIACAGNFHGRSIAIVGLSSEAQYRRGFGPFPAGLKRIPYGNAQALAAAITPNTAAFLVEPIQGEGGIILPPSGYLAACAAICRQHNVLLIADEVQTGLGRTGKLLACEHDHVRPDAVILGKALGGGLLPVSAFLADDAVMQVFTPAIMVQPSAAIRWLAPSHWRRWICWRKKILSRTRPNSGNSCSIVWPNWRKPPLIRAVRGRGLFAGIELDPDLANARQLAEALLAQGVLTKDTHSTVLRLAPPLIIRREELEWGLVRIAETLDKYSCRSRLAA